MFHFIDLGNATPNDIDCYHQPIYPHRWYFSICKNISTCPFPHTAIKDVECFIVDIRVIKLIITVCTFSASKNIVDVDAHVCSIDFGDNYKNISLDYWFFVLCEEVHWWPLVFSHKRPVMWTNFHVTTYHDAMSSVPNTVQWQRMYWFNSWSARKCHLRRGRSVRWYGNIAETTSVGLNRGNDPSQWKTHSHCPTKFSHLPHIYIVEH